MSDALPTLDDRQMLESYRTLDPNACGIYIVTNVRNGKQYIGKTEQTFGRRKSSHLKAEGRCTHFYNAIHKHGTDAFVWDFFAVPHTDDALDELEIRLIALMGTLTPNGYNLTTGGQGGKITEITRARMSAGAKKSQGRQEVKDKRAATFALPDVRARHSEGVRNAWARPGERERRSAISKEAANRPEEKARRSAKAKELWARPGYRERHAAAMQKVRARKRQEQEAAQRASNSALFRWDGNDE